MTINEKIIKYSILKELKLTKTLLILSKQKITIIKLIIWGPISFKSVTSSVIPAIKKTKRSKFLL